MPITVASDPIIPPPRPEPARQASQGAAEPFAQLLEAAAPAESKPEPRRAESRRRDEPSHGEEVRAVRSNRPTDADDVTRTNGRDKAPPPKPEQRADEAEVTDASAAGEEPTSTENGAAIETTVIAIAEGEVTVTTGEDAEALLERAESAEGTATVDTSVDPTLAVVDAPPAQPLPEPVIAAAVIAPAVASEASEGIANAAPEIIIAAAAATPGVNVAAPNNAADTVEAAPPEADAASVAADDFAAAVTGELEGDEPVKPATLAAAAERPARPASDTARAAIPEDAPTHGVKNTAPELSAQAQQAPANERAAPHARAAVDDTPADAPATAAKPANDVPIAQNTATPTPTMPVPTMWAADVRLRAEAPVPIAGLAVEIVTRAQEGLKSFEIRLDPPELGRVDVRLDVDRGGNVTTRLTVDRVETLDILRRDSANLERALQQAGLKTDGGLEFSLRDQSLAHRDQSQPEQQNGRQSRLIVTEDEVAASEAARRGYGRLLGLGTGVDIRV